MDLHSGTPFWPARDGIPATYARLDGDVQCEIAVLGAGITGALVAHRLVQRGHDVIVVDAADVAGGSTAASSGLLLYETDVSLTALAGRIGTPAATRIYRLGLEAIDEIESLHDALGTPCGFSRRPALYLASTRRDARRLAIEFELRRRSGFELDLLSATDIGARYSFSAPAAIRSHGCAEIDAYRFTHAVLATAQRGGARVYARTAVTRRREERAGFVLETAARRRIGAQFVINAGGYSSAGRRTARSVRVNSSWAFVSEPVRAFAGWPDRCLIWETARPYFYARTTDDGRVLAGGEDEAPADGHARSKLMDRKIRRLAARMQGMFPEIRVHPDFCWAATFARTADSLPVIGRSRSSERLIHVLGYGGNGITFSMIGARSAVRLIEGRRDPDAGLFAVDRAS
ncbi:MAG TPA: FAD-dependent oxidoreductase [Vicinamibacterales bacterium]|nr:FAD-dependent oxidoreductase [Vicinamibacterales bacterium]